MTPQPLDYRARVEDVAAASSPLPVNPGGLISLGCFFLWIACIVAAAVAYRYDAAVKQQQEWAGLWEFMLPACAGMLLLPIGGLVGLLSVFTRFYERGTPLLGLALNGLAAAALVLL